MIAAVDPRLVATVDAVVVAAVGITARTLADSPLGDVTMSQWRILALLHASNGGRRLGGVAAAAGMSASSASRMVARLIGRGFVCSVPEPDDRRAIRLGLTDVGRGLVDDVLDRRHEAIRRCLDGTSFSSEFRAEFGRLASSLVEAAGGQP